MHTAQVYNLVLSDTIEGKIFLLLDDKLKEIAKALGKVDEHGEVAEDLRTQILGQLSERLNYESLYSQALSDPELKRTRLELEAAVSNANEARQVVFELFQDLDRFSLEDYQPFSDVTEGMGQVARFLGAAVEEDGKRFVQQDNKTFVLSDAKTGQPESRFTTERDASMDRKDVELLGLDHPLVVSYMTRFRNLPATEIGVRVRSENNRGGVLSLWQITTLGDRGELRSNILPLAVDSDGQRVPAWERQVDRMFQLPPSPAPRQADEGMLSQIVEPTLQRELVHRGIASEQRGYEARLIGWVEVCGAAGGAKGRCRPSTNVEL